MPGRAGIAGIRSDRDETFARFGRYMEGTNGTFKAELEYVCADEDGRVLAFHRNTGSRNGRSLDIGCCIVFQVENGRIRGGRRAD